MDRAGAAADGLVDLARELAVECSVEPTKRRCRRSPRRSVSPTPPPPRSWSPAPRRLRDAAAAAVGGLAVPPEPVAPGGLVEEHVTPGSPAEASGLVATGCPAEAPADAAESSSDASDGNSTDDGDEAPEPPLKQTRVMTVEPGIPEALAGAAPVVSSALKQEREIRTERSEEQPQSSGRAELQPSGGERFGPCAEAGAEAGPVEQAREDHGEDAFADEGPARQEARAGAENDPAPAAAAPWR